MTLFWKDTQRDVSFSYTDLVTELSQREERHPVVQTENPAELFIESLMAIAADKDLTILDSEFSTETLSHMGYGKGVSSQTEPAPDIQLDKPEDLPSELEAASDEWTVGLYTSGTTGTPNQVNQTLGSLTRSVRRSNRFSDNIWAFAYNPSHLSGLQVFFQAVMNLNPMVYIFEQTVDQINKSIRAHGITHISATPTFYRLRLQRLDGVYQTVERLTSGGEKFEPSLREILSKRFPNAKFRNVYAITEAGSLLQSDGELFTIPDDLEDSLKITEDNELAIHDSLLSKSTSMEINGEWFHTGDLVEFVDDNRFKFVGRKSDFVNVAGYRVNPYKVEQVINSVEGVQTAAVTARESSVTGHILVAKIQSAVDADPNVVKGAVKEAVDDLEPWKQPRVIEIVDELEQSRSGKRVR